MKALHAIFVTCVLVVLGGCATSPTPAEMESRQQQRRESWWNEYQTSGQLDLMKAIQRGDLAAVKNLVEHAGANVNAQCSGQRSTPLSVTIRECPAQAKVEMVRYLVEKGANVNCTIVTPGSVVPRNEKQVLDYHTSDFIQIPEFRYTTLRYAFVNCEHANYETLNAMLNIMRAGQLGDMKAVRSIRAKSTQIDPATADPLTTDAALYMLQDELKGNKDVEFVDAEGIHYNAGYRAKKVPGFVRFGDISKVHVSYEERYHVPLVELSSPVEKFVFLEGEWVHFVSYSYYDAQGIWHTGARKSKFGIKDAIRILCPKAEWTVDDSK